MEPLSTQALRPLYTLVPGHPPIELVAYYSEFAGYYPDCELQTKRWFVENIQAKWTIYDIGANIGYYSILFSQLAEEGLVYSFEPTITIELLKRNVAHHRRSNIYPAQAAVGMRSGTLEDDVFRLWGNPPERMAYQFTTIDDLVFEQSFKVPDCLKIDVDSFDFEVLRGAERTLLEYDPWVIVELNHALAKRNQSVGEALEWLAARGYQSAHVLDHENFVLKKSMSWARSGAPARLGVSLTFEQRPILLPQAFDKGDELKGVFDLASPQFHNNAEMSGTVAKDVLRLMVPGPQWNYAASWPVAHGSLGSDPLRVEVVGTTRGGAIAWGFVAQDGNTFLGEQLTVQPGAERRTVVIEMVDPASTRRLMLRNADPDGSAAEVSVTSISVYRIVPARMVSVSSLLSREKIQLSLAECELALAGRDGYGLQTVDSCYIDIVPVEELSAALEVPQAFCTGPKIYLKNLASFQTEIDEAAVYSFIYRSLKPKRHLEFGTWEGFGVTVCAQACDAEIWTVNLPGGELDSQGDARYTSPSPNLDTRALRKSSVNREASPADSGDAIGWRYKIAGYEPRVHQILTDSRDLDITQFGPAFFDTILIDGGHLPDIVASDTNKAIALLRPSGLMIWHDFCPDVETLRTNEAPRGVVRAIIDNFAHWRPHFKRIFWLRPTWMLLGVKR